MKLFYILTIFLFPYLIGAQIGTTIPQIEEQSSISNNKFENIYQMRTQYDNKEEKFGKVNKQFERWYDMAEKRLQPSGRFDIKRDPLLRTYFDFMNTQNSLAETHTGNWDYLGGSSYSVNVRIPEFSQGSGGVGRVNCITVDPNNSNILYAGAAIGGLWKSTDSGASWNSLTDGMSSLSVSWITIDPTNTNRIFLASGDADGRGSYDNYRESGVIFTEDGGVTWRTTNFFNDQNPTNLNVYKILMDPTDPETMYACTNRGFFHTDDSWNSRDTINNIVCWDAEFKPGNSDSLYFCSGHRVRSYVNSTQLVNLLVNFAGISQCNNSSNRIEIEVLDSNPELLYAFRGRSSSSCAFNGFINFSLSKNAGTTWANRSIGNDNNNNQVLGYDTLGGDNRSQAIYDMCFVVDPNDAANLMVGGINLWTSADTGLTWTSKSYYRRQTDLAYTHADQHDLIADGNKIYVCNDGGLYKTTNFGGSFTDLNDDLGINMLYHVDSYKNDKDFIVGGLQDNGTNEYNTDKSITQIVPGDGLRIIIDYEDSDIQYNMWYRGSVGMTTDNWDTYTEVFGNTGNNAWDTPMIMDVNDSDTLFLARDSFLFRTFDQWDNDYDQEIGVLDYITDLAQSTSVTKRLYVAGRSKVNSIWSTKIYRLDDAYHGSDMNINDISGAIPDSLSCSGLAVKDNNSYGVWACFNGSVAGAKVYYKPSLNGAWQNRTGNLPNVNMNDIIYDPGSNNGVYLATDIGVFYRDGDLGDWIFFSNGLPNVVVKKLELIDDENILRAATYGRGLWESGTFQNCIASSDLTPANDPGDSDYTGIQRYQTSHSIVSTRNVVGGQGTDVRYRAGNYIELQEGFWTKQHNQLQVEIGPCNAEGGKYLIKKKLTGNLEFNSKQSK